MDPYFDRLRNNIVPVDEEDRNAIARDFVDAAQRRAGRARASRASTSSPSTRASASSTSPTTRRTTSAPPRPSPTCTPSTGDRPNLTSDAGDLGVPAGAGRAPGRPASTSGRKDGEELLVEARARSAGLRGRGGHPAAADALRHRPARGPGGARAYPSVHDLPGVGENLLDHPESVIVWETDGPDPGELGDGLATPGLFVRRDPDSRGPGPDVPLLPDPVHRQPGAARLRTPRARRVDDPEHPQAAQPRPALPDQRRPRGQTRPRLPLLHRRGRLRRPHARRRHQARPRDRRDRAAGRTGSSARSARARRSPPTRSSASTPARSRTPSTTRRAPAGWAPPTTNSPSSTPS